MILLLKLNLFKMNLFLSFYVYKKKIIIPTNILVHISIFLLSLLYTKCIPNTFITIEDTTLTTKKKKHFNLIKLNQK